MAKLKIMHQVPGRIRMKIPSAKGNQAQLEAYKEVLGVIPGVEGIDINPVTGSIILKYDADQHGQFRAGFHDHLDRHHGEPKGPRRPPTNEIDAVASKIQQEAEYLAEHSETARAVVEFCGRADREIRLVTGNVLDLKMLLAAGVVGFTVFEVGAAAATPVWVTLLLFGLNHFIEMQTAEIEDEPAAVPVKA
jgi:hypothetical protein